MTRALALTLALLAAAPAAALTAELRVIDGDTIVVGGEHIRIADLDAPEISRARCPEERQAGERARDALAAILDTHAWSLGRTGRDRYGRTLAYVWISDGRYIDVLSVGDRMAEAGVARRWIGRTRDWCAILRLRSNQR